MSFRLVPDPIFVLDAAGTIVRSNPAGESFLSLGGRPGPARRFEEYLSPPSRPGWSERLRQSSNGDGAPVRLKMGPLGRPAIPVEARLLALPSGTPGGWVVTVRDVSEREALVQALTERAALLARSNRDLQEFAYVASHDLQEPLRMVASYTQLVSERYRGKLDKDADEFLGFATEGATRMRTLIDDLLAYARVESRGQPYEEVPVSQALDVALRNLGPAMQSTGATVVAGPLPTIRADRAQLVQVFQNLVGNAIKFHADAPPRVEVLAADRGEAWEFAVRDNGLGIPSEYADRIFLVFQRLNRREEFPGSGIGLSIAKRVVERHGGRIWVESTGRRGEGSTFRFTIPKEPRPPLGTVAPPPSTGRSSADRLAEELVARRLEELV